MKYTLHNPNWIEIIDIIKLFSKIFLTMAMAAIGLSTNLKDIKNMGYKPFIVGFIAMLTVGLVCIITIESYQNFLFSFLTKYFFLKLDKNLLINAAAIPKKTANKIENSP